MGANRPGTRRTQKMKRFRKEMERLMKKEQAKETAAAPSQPAPPAGK